MSCTREGLVVRQIGLTNERKFLDFFPMQITLLDPKRSLNVNIFMKQFKK